MKLLLNSNDANYYYSKGYSHHKAGEYRKAWESWVVAHGLQNGNYHVAAANQILNALMSLSVVSHDLPDQGEDLIFIVGMPRTGTTLLEQILVTNENIIGHGERREFISILDEALINKNLKLDENTIMAFQTFYRKDFNKTQSPIYHVDKMPRNALAIPLIRTVFPKCKIINTSRDRFSTCMSIYSSNFSDFTPYTHRWETLNLFYDHYLLISNNFKDYTYTVSFDKLIIDFETTIRALYTYLNLDYTGNEINFYKNKNEVKTCSKEQIKLPLNKNGLTQWLPYRPIVYGESYDSLY